jgi:hypothetical protein
VWSASVIALAPAIGVHDYAEGDSPSVAAFVVVHLVTLGVIGRGRPGLDAETYHRVHAQNTIDFAEYHDYFPTISPYQGPMSEPPTR